MTWPKPPPRKTRKHAKGMQFDVTFRGSAADKENLDKIRKFMHMHPGASNREVMASALNVLARCAEGTAAVFDVAELLRILHEKTNATTMANVLAILSDYFKRRGESLVVEHVLVGDGTGPGIYRMREAGDSEWMELPTHPADPTDVNRLLETVGKDLVPS